MACDRTVEVLHDGLAAAKYCRPMSQHNNMHNKKHKNNNSEAFRASTIDGLQQNPETLHHTQKKFEKKTNKQTK